VLLRQGSRKDLSERDRGRGGGWVADMEGCVAPAANSVRVVSWTELIAASSLK